MDNIYVDINKLVSLHSKYSKNRVYFQYVINYHINVAVNHYLNVIDIYLEDLQYNYFPEQLKNIIAQFNEIGEVYVDEENLSITIYLNILKVFLKQNKIIKSYYKVYSSDSEATIRIDINNIVNMGIISQNICSDIDDNKDNLTRLVLESEAGDVIYFFSIARSSNNFDELLSIILLLRDKKVDLIIEDIYIDPSLSQEQLFKMIEDLRSIYEFKCRSLKIKKAQENVYKRGDKQIGRPKLELYDLPEYVFDNYKLLVNGEINMSQFADMCGVSRPTAYKYRTMIKENNK